MTICSSCARRLVVSALTGMVLIPALAAGQPPSGSAADGSRRVTVFGSVGYNSQVDDESSLGKGAGFSGGAAIWLGRKVSVGVEVVGLTHERDLTYYAVPADRRDAPIPVSSSLTGTATYVLGQLTYTFSTSRIQPFVSGSLGVMHYSGTPWSAMFPGPGHDPDARFQTTASAMGAAGGVNVMLSRGFWVGPHAGLLTSGTAEHGTKAAVYGGVRAGFDW